MLNGIEVHCREQCLNSGVIEAEGCTWIPVCLVRDTGAAGSSYQEWIPDRLGASHLNVNATYKPHACFLCMKEPTTF